MKSRVLPVSRTQSAYKQITRQFLPILHPILTIADVYSLYVGSCKSDASQICSESS